MKKGNIECLDISNEKEKIVEEIEEVVVNEKQNNINLSEDLSNKVKEKKIAIAFAVLAAILYAINIPVSKRLLENVSPTMLASFLYLGAGIGLLIYKLVISGQKRNIHI